MLYAEHKGLAPDVFDAMWAIVRRMDSAELEWWGEQVRHGVSGGD
jgi:hypothetical protein